MHYIYIYTYDIPCFPCFPECCWHLMVTHGISGNLCQLADGFGPGSEECTLQALQHQVRVGCCADFVSVNRGNLHGFTAELRCNLELTLQRNAAQWQHAGRNWRLWKNVGNLSTGKTLALTKMLMPIWFGARPWLRWGGLISSILQSPPKEWKTATNRYVSPLLLLGYQTTWCALRAFATQCCNGIVS